MLKLIQGTVAAIPRHGGRKHPQQELIQVDTSNILIIVGGAFAGLDAVIQQRTEKGGIGFNADVSSKDDSKRSSELLQQVEPEDLIKFGLIPELIGRFRSRCAHRAGRGRIGSDIDRTEKCLG